MIKKVNFGKTPSTCHCFSECPDTDNEELKNIINGLLKALNDFLDDTYRLYLHNHPKVTRPKLYVYIREDNIWECNAFTDSSDVFLSFALLSRMYEFVETKMDMSKILTEQRISEDKILALNVRILIFILELIVAHELSHIWHGHAKWKRAALKHVVPTLLNESVFSELVETYSTESNEGSLWNISNLKRVNDTYLIESGFDLNYLQQVLEMDADCFAMNLVIAQINIEINEMLHMHHSKGSTDQESTTQMIRNHHSFLLGLLADAAGIMCAFFDSKRIGKPFDSIHVLLSGTHPVPAIRFFKMHTAMVDIIHHVFPNEKIAGELLSQRGILTNDIFNYDGENVDLQNCFWAPAQTKESQEFVSLLEHGWNYIRDSLQRYALLPLPFKYPEEYMNEFKHMIWYDKEGNPLSRERTINNIPIVSK